MTKFCNFLNIGLVEKGIIHGPSNQINTTSYPRKRVSSIFDRMQHTKHWIPACAGMTNIIDCLIQSLKCSVRSGPQGYDLTYINWQVTLRYDLPEHEYCFCKQPVGTGKSRLLRAR